MQESTFACMAMCPMCIGTSSAIDYIAVIILLAAICLIMMGIKELLHEIGYNFKLFDLIVDIISILIFFSIILVIIYKLLYDHGWLYDIYKMFWLGSL